MAITWIKPLHVNKGKTIAQTITDRTDYAENPDKTRKGELVTGYQCTPRLAGAEFVLSKQNYSELTGRGQGRNNILAYHIRQAFKPGEITPDDVCCKRCFLRTPKIQQSSQPIRSSLRRHSRKGEIIYIRRERQMCRSRLMLKG